MTTKPALELAIDLRSRLVLSEAESGEPLGVVEAAL